MDRTRAVFFGIIGVTLLIIFVVVGSQLFNRAGNAISGITGTAAPTEVPRGTVVISFASGNTKQNWINAVVKKFNDSNTVTNAGNRIMVEVKHVTSGDSMDAILAGELQPVAWSPGDASWAAQINAAWQQKNNLPIASQTCAPTVYAPLGFAMWKPMAETLGWPNKPISWETIVKLAEDPDGWSSLGRPEWGTFRFGHTHPSYANSGLLALTSFAYNIAGKTEGLTPSDIYDPKMEEALRSLEISTSKYGTSAPKIMEIMAKQGPSYLHAAAVFESEVIRTNIEQAKILPFPLAFIFPAGGTMWSEQPYCILDNADWVSDEQEEGAAIFRDYLLAKDQQAMAIDNYLRPLDENIPLHAPLDLANGTDPSVNISKIPALPSTSAETSAAIIDLFLTSKRKSTVLLVLDTSGSMQDENRITVATQATAEFLRRLSPEDRVGVLSFSDEFRVLQEPALVRDVSEPLAKRVEGLIADGNTALYSAVCESYRLLSEARDEDRANNEPRLYGIVLLSDGEDTIGTPTENRMFSQCLPANAEADGIKVFPVAFGNEADQDVLNRIATVTGGRMFTADTNSIKDVYRSISAEQ